MDLKNVILESSKNIYMILFGVQQEALRGEKLKLGECVRLMYTVGRVLAVLPVDSIMEYLNQILMPYVEELQILVTLEVCLTFSNYNINL
jgi:hypothetical protein